MAILVCKTDESLVLSRSKASHIKEINFNELKNGNSFNIVEEDGKFIGVASEEQEGDEDNPIYTFVTNEFGLYGMSHGMSAKIKIRFCDKGMMVIDLIQGGILVRPEDKVLLGTRGIETAPALNLNEIYWVNMDKLLSYAKYWLGLKSTYIYDFEYTFTVKGECINGMSHFGVHPHNDEDIDISGGAIAAVEAQLQAKAAAKQSRDWFNSLVAESSGSNYEFDDEDDYDDTEDEYEDDDYDGSDY